MLRFLINMVYLLLFIIFFGCSAVKQPKHVGNLSGKSFQDNIAHAFSVWTPDSKINIWELSGLHEGDIMLSHDEDPRNALIDTDKMWPKGIVPYYISEDEFDEEEIDIIKNAVKEIEEETCVKFRDYKKDDDDYVVVKGDAEGCWSFVGRKHGGQILNLSEKCVRHGVVVHEFLHALGLYHQQSAPNRDDYVTVNWDNIEPDHKHNFDKYNTSTVTDYGVGYDYNSIMHYSSHAFSKNEKKTLEPKQKEVKIGQRKHISDKDIKKIRKIYNCDSKSGMGEFGLSMFEDLISL
uniref:Metalloendopeptidase n=2 Tax=Clastoptera arizonana TaxID=38151 RepID=A0A1B6E272_9HEMI